MKISNFVLYSKCREYLIAKGFIFSEDKGLWLTNPEDLFSISLNLQILESEDDYVMYTSPELGEYPLALSSLTEFKRFCNSISTINKTFSYV
jgi:hypothetical protein